MRLAEIHKMLLAEQVYLHLLLHYANPLADNFPGSDVIPPQISSSIQGMSAPQLYDVLSKMKVLQLISSIT